MGVVDTAFSGTGAPPVVTCPVTTLVPQATTTCTSTYTVTQADVDAGSIVNTAVASGTPPTGPPVTSPPSTVTVATAPASALTLAKTAVPSTMTAVGQTITYSYAIVNAGNATLTGVGVADTAFSGSGTPPVVTCPVTTLAPQASTTCTSTYTVTQADLNAGSIVNTATASGTTPTGAVITSNASTATVTAEAVLSLTLVKTASPSTVTAAGQTITYSYLVTNIGNVAVTDVRVADTAPPGSGVPAVVTCPVTTLAPQASTTCTGTYTVTQTDIDAGSIVNTATAFGTSPTGPPVASPPSTATVTVTPNPGLTLSKTAAPRRVSAAGQRITYSYLVTNTGNVTLTDLGLRDTGRGSGVPAVITCPVTTLAPQASTTCTGIYVVRRADINAGVIVNTATASGRSLSGPVVTSSESTAAVVVAPAVRSRADGGADRQKSEIRNHSSNSTKIKITDRKKKHHHRHRGGHSKRRR
ncbi:hypothetical protein [Streptosporangium sp. NPDC002721]|uniref:DUF7507 domain-containing protein n=1 Tax=Streptosporangium sp. NPDC002721 TaxID=3366188 RepID=UPI0036A61BEC